MADLVSFSALARVVNVVPVVGEEKRGERKGGDW
jgi:hypothetical protein